MTQTKTMSPDAAQVDEAQSASWWTFQRITIISVGAFFGLYILVFLIGLIAAMVWNAQAAGFFAYFRDLITIALAISSVLIVVGLGIMLIQIARFINLLRSEIKPISQDAKEVVRNVRVTSAFVSKHAVEPIIRFQTFSAGLIAFLLELANIARLLQRRDNDEETDENSEAAEA